MKVKVIDIDALSIHGMGILFPHYCRGAEDKVRWIALKRGYIKTIRPIDEVVYHPETDRYRLIRRENI